MPIGASAGRINSPSAASLRPNSLPEHNIPEDSTPRTLACLIEMPGSCAPTRAQGTFTPTRTLAAPQTICSNSPSPEPAFTTHTFRRSASGCFCIDNTSATTTLSKAGAAVSIASTSSPAIVRACASSPLVSGGSTRVRSQFSENFMGAYSRLRRCDEHHSIKLLKEAQIILEK